LTPLASGHKGRPTSSPEVEPRDHGGWRRSISQSIRVLHVINQLDGRGGAEVSLRENILGSVDDGLAHGVVTLGGENNVAEFEVLRESGVAIFALPHGQSRRAAYRHVVTSIETFRPTLLHTSLFEADLVGRLAALRTRTPVVSSFVNTSYDPRAAEVEDISVWKRDAVRRIDRFLARNATTAFHAISQATADHAVTHLGVDPRMIRVVPRGRSLQALGVRSSARREAVRTRLGWQERPIVINVARQEPQKGHKLLVEAMTGVLEEYPDALLVLVGRSGRSSHTIRQRIEELGIGAAVVQLGMRTDVPDLLAAADVFAFSSLYEGLGGAVVEAAGLGVPVVAFDVPAVREVLGDAHPWLVPIGDATALGTAVTLALAGGKVVEDVAATQLERFHEQYELQAAVTGMTRLYRDVAVSVRSRRPRRIGRSVRVRVAF
jgi:glycosyltransferase involved in cell wall biosynthesis